MRHITLPDQQGQNIHSKEMRPGIAGDVDITGVSSHAQASSAQLTRWLPTIFRLLAISLGGLHAWTAAVKQSMSEDGISYLDIGDAYMRGDWGMAINTVWSPFYSWILGAAMRVLRPPMSWEFSVVHLVNFVIYLFALLSFEFFWRQLSDANRGKEGAAGSDAELGLPRWAWLSLGYTLFIWTSLSLIRIWAITPDMLAAAFVYLAAGVLVRISLGGAGWTAFIAFGLVLGLAYLAKAAMFPLALVFLGAGLLAAGELRRAAPRSVAAVIAFALIAAPYITILSVSKARLTFGDAGRITYLRYAHDVPYPHWRPGVVSGVGAPEHPTRQIFDDPRVFEFATPVGGTYPLSYDPSYWYEGVTPRFELKRQLAVMISSAQFYFDLFIRQQGGALAIVLLLLLMARRQRRRPKSLAGDEALLVVALAAFGMYALVYAEGRYIAAFVVLFWAGLLSRVRLVASPSSRRLVHVGGAIAVLFMLINIGGFNLGGLSKIMASEPRPAAAASQLEAPRYGPAQFAEKVTEMGMQRGDEIAYIGYSFGAFFARLARLRIIAEIPDAEAERFWRADHSTRSQVIQTIAGTGAKALIAEWVSPEASLDGWERIGHSRHFIYRLQSQPK
jgi:hypothetical protein